MHRNERAAHHSWSLSTGVCSVLLMNCTVYVFLPSVSIVTSSMRSEARFTVAGMLARAWAITCCTSMSFCDRSSMIV